MTLVHEFSSISLRIKGLPIATLNNAQLNFEKQIHFKNTKRKTIKMIENKVIKVKKNWTIARWLKRLVLFVFEDFF